MDGDTDVPSVQQDFAAALYQLMRRTRRKEEESLRGPDSSMNTRHPNGIHASNEYAWCIILGLLLVFCIGKRQ